MGLIMQIISHPYNETLPVKNDKFLDLFFKERSITYRKVKKLQNSIQEIIQFS